MEIPENVNQALAFKLASKDGEAKLRSICMSLKRHTARDPITGDKVSFLDQVYYGSTKLSQVAEVLGLNK